jgi:PAS domain S-box-containing protein
MEVGTPVRDRHQSDRLNRMGWLSIPILFVALIFYFYSTNSTEVYQHPRLTILLGLVFTTFGSVLVAFLAGRSFLYHGLPSLLMLGCGALVLGAGSVVSTTIDPTDINGQVAVYNLSVFLSALCHLAGALIGPRKSKAKVNASEVWLGFAYLFSIFIVWITKVSLVEGLGPPFFVQGQGGTLLRQIVLIFAIGMFLASAALLKQPKSKSSRFNNWYAMALCLMATGLFGVLLQHAQASLIGWAGRAAQYLGGIFMFVAAAVSVRESRAWRITLEASLRESEQQLSLTLTAGRIATWDWRIMTGEVVWNDEHFRMMGYKPGVVKPSYQAWAERVHPDDRPFAESLLAQALKQGADYVAGFRALWPDGTVRWIEARGHFESNAAGQPVRSYGVMIDVTERRQADEALRQQAQLLDLSSEAIFAWEFGGAIEYWNQGAETLYGYSREEAIGCISHELLATPFPGEKAAFLAELERDGQWHGELTHRTKDGRVLAVESRLKMVPQGNRRLVLETTRDITARKQAEEVLRLSNENLEKTVKERTATLVVANQELENRSKQLRRLSAELANAEQRERKRLANVLHDGLQQYLLAAKLQIGGLIHPENDPVMNQTAVEIERLLGDAVKVSRSLAAELSPPILHDAGLLAGLEWLSRWMSKKHGLKAEIQMEQMDAPVLADDVKVLLFEAVRELLLNVVKHAKTKSARIYLSHENSRHLRITVSDDGVGFDGSTAQVGGITPEGFGLFSIHERISLVGGKLEYESSPGNGARFTLTAPLSVPKPKQHETSPIVHRNEGEPILAHLSTGKIRILIVDDHHVMREGLARLLNQEPDFEVVDQANDGQQAIQKAGTLMPHVVLMDISMPVMDGIEATKIIRKQHPNIRIVGLSLYTESERAKEMLDAGADFYMTKSERPAGLKAAIRACAVNKEGIVDSQSMKSRPL